jgi:hypothetical protein
MMATPREVLLMWVTAALEAGRSEPRPGCNRGNAGLPAKDLERLAVALQANRGEEP